jgi:hypothetical protein
MHTTAYLTGKHFFETYVHYPVSIVEIGSQNVNGSLRDHAPQGAPYCGVDFVAGAGVDVVLQDPYKFPFPDNTFDVLVTSSCFEHSEMFWLSFLEGMRILKDDGIMYCNAPSSRMVYHRYPVDCWRFFPDAAKGLQSWGIHNGIPVGVLESFVVNPIQNDESICLDWCSVFIKNGQHQYKYPKRMIDAMPLPWVNGFKFTGNPDENWDNPINFNGSV